METRSTRNTLQPLFGLVAAAVLALASFGAKAEAPAPSRQEASYEVKFLTGMIDHHHMAVMMAELCLDCAVHEELMNLCEEIRMTQMEEIELMQSWLLNWYDLAYEPHMPAGHERMMEHHAQLTGEEFEIAFMEMMVRHHARAVREGLQCSERAYHPELIELCHDIVETQVREIALMQSWLCDWYGICRE